MGRKKEIEEGQWEESFMIPIREQGVAWAHEGCRIDPRSL